MQRQNSPLCLFCPAFVKESKMLFRAKGSDKTFQAVQWNGINDYEILELLEYTQDINDMEKMIKQTVIGDYITEEYNHKFFRIDARNLNQYFERIA